jgi:hypothetical protein
MEMIRRFMMIIVGIKTLVFLEERNTFKEERRVPEVI